MHPLVRCLLIWLMALAVPLQGVAAASLQHCLPAHVPEQASGAQHAEGPSHDVHAHAHHPVDHAAASGTASRKADPHKADPHNAAGTLKAGKCSACAACCVALGLPAQAVQVPVVPADAFMSRLRVAAHFSFVPAGLDRPPRPHLASC